MYNGQLEANFGWLFLLALHLRLYLNAKAQRAGKKCSCLLKKGIRVMKNFALVISSAALTGVVVWIIIGGLNADPQGSKDNNVVLSEKASVGEVEFCKEMAEVKKGLGDLADRVSDVEKNYEALRLAKVEQADQPATQIEEDARVAVVSAKIVQRVDKALGELNTKMKKVEGRITQVAADLSLIRRSLFESQAKASLLDSKRVASETKLAKIRGQMEKLTEFVNEAKAAEDGTVDVNGKSYTVEDLDLKAMHLTAQVDQFTAQLQIYQRKEEIYAEVVSALKSKEQNARDLLEELEIQKKVIQTKRESIETVQAISRMADDVSELHFLSNEEFELRRAEFNASVEVFSDEVDPLLTEPNNLDSTAELLNQLLGEE